MIIEFLGVSGVGKTTIASIYKRKLESEGKTVIWDTYDLYANKGWLSRNVRKAFLVCSYSVSNLHWVKQYAEYLQKNGISIKKRLKPLFNAVFLKRLLTKAKLDNHIHLFDEGAMQYLWATKLRGRTHCTEDDVEDIKRLFGLPDILIVVIASSETIMNRLNTRGEYTEIMSSDKLLEAISDMSVICHEIEEIASSLTKTAFIQNDDESVAAIDADLFPNLL